MEHNTRRPRRNAIVGQSGGPTAAFNATLAGVVRGVLATGGIDRLYGMRNGIEGLQSGRLTDLCAIFTDGNGAPDEDKLRLLAHTPAAALGSCRRKLPDPDDPAGEPIFRALLAVLEQYDIGFFFYIGGNDSMDTVAKLSAYAHRVGFPLTVIGIPKTIDNDLEGTDHTPGFGSAAKLVATTMQEILLDCAVYTIPAVTIVEIMGRNAGWLTAAAALGRVSGGLVPDYVYLPEVDFSMSAFFDDVRQALARHPNVVIAVSEGIHLADGTPVGASAQNVDAFGHAALSGAGKVLEHAVRAELGCKVRSIELNTPQRCGAHILSATDIEESLRVGSAAVTAAAGGVSGVMMTIKRVSDAPYQSEISYCAVADIANLVRLVPAPFINRDGNHVTDECCRAIAPLIAGETLPVFEDGLPRFFVLPDEPTENGNGNA